MSPERLQRQCQATGIALEMLAEGFFKWRPGADLFDPAYPIHLPALTAPEGSIDKEAPEGSQAEAERATTEIALYYRAIGDLHTAVAECIYATGSLLRRGDGVMAYSQYATARAAIEGLGVMFWLLDPDLDGEHRRNRAITEMLRSAAWHPEIQDGILKAFENADIATYEASNPQHGYHAGEPLPGKTALVEDLGVDYHGLSMFAHGEPLGRELLQYRTGNAERTRSEIRATEDHLFDLYAKLLTGTDAVVERWISYTKWPRDIYAEARDASLSKMRNSAHMP